MLLKLLSPSIWQRLLVWAGFPYISLLIWLLPLLLLSSGHSSLMAHDEGLYAWRSRRMFESGDWINPWSEPHHKTPGPYWLIATSYNLFGISETSVRLPSMVFGVLSVLILYEVGKILLGKKVGWLAAAILSVEFLWLQYCRLGTPDVPMIFLVLLAIWSLLKAELHSKYGNFYRFIAGACFGVGFLVRSFMIFLPAIALFPYLIGEYRHHRHLTNPMLYLGFIVGLIPTFVWLWLSFLRFGNDSGAELLNFVFRLGYNDRRDHGIFFYVWNVPIKAFPWFFFSLLGLFLAYRRPLPRYNSILIGFPLVLFVELSLFSTRLSHYSLLLYPFIALLAAVGLDWLGWVYDTKFKSFEMKDAENLSATFSVSPYLRVSVSSYPRVLSYIFGVLAVLLLLAGAIALTLGSGEIRKYAILALALGGGWLILPVVWICRYRFGKQSLTSSYWLAGWLIPAWLTLAVAGSYGFLSDYNPDVRTFLAQPAIAQVLQHYPIHFVQVGGKTGVLLNFYTPYIGKRVDKISELPTSSYAWISAKQASESTTPHQVLGKIQQYQLVQVLP
ncbi:MAG: glycosyltransferase family 39 protein [Chlorogloeopsis fritschii C42_A2020_084]|uniref:ArnT family glycosyltransferase n=1 Tax=Chlorogloeopsis fritschii TaxID=1124 RepID=UPI0019ECA39B|nr:glycosyltransferase family 39 protein [Chlorogloeopsis fritschii]MBF2009017.1 glycosyltransferase family 39 protein [Chlorogloeopsis fritschii C42_A2020_084]